MTRARFRLGIDFGTSTTIAVLRRPEGRVQQLLFDGSPLLSSAVLLGPDGRLHTGRDAAHLARSAPERLEPNPKRRADESSVLLGDAEVDVLDLIAAVLRRVATEAARVAGPVDAVTLTHPADWGTSRRTLLVEAARLAGFAEVDLVAEPVAAATYLAATQEVPAGSCVVVYDLGAGTCDVTLLRRRPDGFEPVASGGLNDLGGLDVDAAIVGFLQATYGTLWTDAATRRQLWDDVRTAKEMLSRASGTVVMVPALGKEVPLGREQLEGLARPVLRPSVAMTRALLADSGVRRAEIAGLFLVGGSSRIPLVATMLHEAIGIAPVVAEQPELVVAEGALQSSVRGAPGDGASPEPAAPAREPGADPATQASYLDRTGRADQADQADRAHQAGRAGQAGRADLTGSGDLGRAAGSPLRAGPHPYLTADPFATAGTALPAAAASPPGRRRRTRLLAAVAAIAVVLVGGAVLLSQLIGDTGDTGEQSQDGREPSIEAVPFDLKKMPDDLCAAVDLTPFATLFEEVPEPPRPSRQLAATGSEAACLTVRLHGTVRATFAAAIRVTPARSQAAADYKMLIGDNAALNDRPVPLTGLGEEAVIYTVKGSTAQAKSQLTFLAGVRDGNLTWQLRLSVDRRDQAGWTAAQQQQLRDKLVEVTRAALPKVATDLR